MFFAIWKIEKSVVARGKKTLGTVCGGMILARNVLLKSLNFSLPYYFSLINEMDFWIDWLIDWLIDWFKIFFEQAYKRN